jgi:hypothetical protein
VWVVKGGAEEVVAPPPPDSGEASDCIGLGDGDVQEGRAAWQLPGADELGTQRAGELLRGAYVGHVVCRSMPTPRGAGRSVGVPCSGSPGVRLRPVTRGARPAPAPCGRAAPGMGLTWSAAVSSFTFSTTTSASSRCASTQAESTIACIRLMANIPSAARGQARSSRLGFQRHREGGLPAPHQPRVGTGRPQLVCLRIQRLDTHVHGPIRPRTFL